MNKFIKTLIIAILVTTISVTAVYAISTTHSINFAGLLESGEINNTNTLKAVAIQQDNGKNKIVNDEMFIQFNKDMYELYNIQSTKIKFDEKNPESFVYQPSKEINGIEYILDLEKLKQGQGTKFNLNSCLDGSYFVYSASIPGGSRKRPSTLTYDTTKRGKTENQYIGYNIEGAFYENPAYPWNSWSSSRPLKSWEFIREPWLKDVIVKKYNLNGDGGLISKKNMNSRNKVVDLTKSIELGIYAKYIAFSAKETVKDGGVSPADLDKSIYYGYKIGSAELNKKFGFPKPSAFGANDTWQDYVYILTPPTKKTWGSGFMFYENKDAINGVDYVTIPLAPLDIIEQQKVTELTYSDVTGCFLSEPKKVYNSTTKKYEMKTWVIRSLRDTNIKSGSIPIQIWLKQGADAKYDFVNDKMGTKIFDEEVTFTSEHPYWVKEITYPVPGKGQKSGIFVLDGGTSTPAVNFVWHTDAGNLLFGTHTTSKEKYFDFLPWDKIEAEYGLKREKAD